MASLISLMDRSISASSSSLWPSWPIMLAWMASELGSFTFFDIGANVGAYSMVMASQANVQRVMAFEPQPDCLAELRRNI